MESPRSPCPVVFALDVFGDRWTLLVIRDLALRGRSSYSDFLKAGEAISTNILAARLKRLEAQGVISKQRDPEHGSKFIYRLTPKGVDLLPVLMEMMRWSVRYDPNSPLSPELRARFEKDPQGLLREWTAHLTGEGPSLSESQTRV